MKQASFHFETVSSKLLYCPIGLQKVGLREVMEGFMPFGEVAQRLVTGLSRAVAYNA